MKLKPIERLMSKVSFDIRTGCWNWKGSKNKEGYGNFRFNDTCVSAHRITYVLFRGELTGEVDHLCRNRACINPFHMEDVSHKENSLRGTSFSALNAKKTHCSRGHAFTKENTRLERFGRRCEACRKLGVKARKCAR